jgi:dihydropteroate synthase
MHKDTFFQKKHTLNIGGKLLDLTSPKVMGIINITPDSFYEGSRKQTTDAILQLTEKMLLEGAGFLDLGAYSSRPGATDISLDEELQRLLPAVETISKNFPEAVLSIDTFRSRVAKDAIKAGAHIINDISGGSLDADMFGTVARLQVPYILMHMKGTPQTMVRHVQYADVVEDVFDYFVDKYHQLKQLGVKDVIIDPGFGFAKTPEQGYTLIKHLNRFDVLQLPILVGISRKKMIYNLLGSTARDALNGTTALNTIALSKGANILRVHDVKAAVEAVKIFMACN